MKILYRLSDLRGTLRRPVVTLGAFDGIHLAHQTILRSVIRRARKIHGTSVVLTFHPHPLQVLRPDISFSSLTCIEHRLRLLSRLGLDLCVVLRFSKRFSRVSAEDFIKRILVRRLGVREVWAGFNYAFGRDRRGSVQLLKAYGRRYHFRVKVIPEIKAGGRRISSTQIRQRIAKGNLDGAARLLGRPYSLYGKVVKGKGRGKRLGYPTANLCPYHEAILPKGVYAVWASVGAKGYLGILNIGTRPTFETKPKVIPEVHLLDFRGNLYGKKMEVFFLKKIRKEKKFLTQEALVRRIQKDETFVRKIGLKGLRAILRDRKGRLA